MNSVMNGKVHELTPFQEVYIQPAAGDNGTALGAAFYVWHQLLGQSRRFVMGHAYRGPEFGDTALPQALHASRAELERQGCTVQRVADEDELCHWTAERLAAGNVVGWFQGRMEWGARALGNRSILADPRRPDMREIINTKIGLDHGVGHPMCLSGPDHSTYAPAHGGRRSTVVQPELEGRIALDMIRESRAEHRAHTIQALHQARRGAP